MRCPGLREMWLWVAGSAWLVWRRMASLRLMLLREDGRLVAPCGTEVAYHGLVHLYGLYGADGAEFMAIFTRGRLEVFDPITDEAATG
jgi:hypothetical protein